MKFIVKPSNLTGETFIPASKSHTIRSVFIASLAEGVSEIINPLVSADALSAVEACRTLGAEIKTGDNWIVKGVGGHISPQSGPITIDVGNSGTTARFVIGMAALAQEDIIITGDAQTRSRPMGPLIKALNNLGAEVSSMEGNGSLPIKVKGRLKGGTTSVSGVTSQFLSSLLINCPLANSDCEITVDDLNERPYVEMTLAWLDSQNIKYEHEGLNHFKIKGNQKFKHFSGRVPSDFSSATFFLCAGAMTDSNILLKGLDTKDSQGDKKVIEFLRGMEANISISPEGIRIKGGNLKGCEIDLNDTPDALPAMAVAGCLATGKTVLRNVPQARLKETDRIAVMKYELTKMGADIEELPDGLIIRESKLKGCIVQGHGDHRIVMSLSIGGLAAEGVTMIEGAEAVRITFPNFMDIMKDLNGNIEKED